MFFFRQKTAYWLRISDWSSDVCSSDLVALVLADQRTRDRRRNRDLPLLDVGFQVAHDLVALLLAAVGVGQQHGRAENDTRAGIERGDVDDLRMRQLSLELLDPALDEALLLTQIGRAHV